MFNFKTVFLNIKISKYKIQTKTKHMLYDLNVLLQTKLM